jgi:hypothetical protein
LFPRFRIVLKQVESVSFKPVHVATVELGILLGNFQRFARRIHSDDFIAHAGEMQSKPSLVGEDVERSSVRVALCGGVILPLIKERPRLLPIEKTVDDLAP